MRWRYKLVQTVASAVTLFHHSAPLARISRCGITRSPIAERGWFITLTAVDGSEINGWIDENHHCHLLGNHSISRSLRRTLWTTTRALDAEAGRIDWFGTCYRAPIYRGTLSSCYESLTITEVTMTALSARASLHRKDIS